MGKPGAVSKRRSSRKRSKSCDSTGSSENRPANKRARRAVAAQKQQLKNLVGLRNLGNTCFMSAVLQSLSNIHEFCRVLNQLPSLSGSQDGGASSSSNSVKREKRNKNGMVALAGGGVDVDGAIMTEELRKILLALSKGGAKTAISPEALFHVIWKVVPRFR